MSRIIKYRRTKLKQVIIVSKLDAQATYKKLSEYHLILINDDVSVKCKADSIDTAEK